MLFRRSTGLPHQRRRYRLRTIRLCKAEVRGSNPLGSTSQQRSSNANSAMLAQVLRPGGGNGNAGAAVRCRLTVNEATLLSGLPNRQAWARRPPGRKDFGVGPWVRADPFEEIEDEGVDSVGHDGLSHQCAASGFDAHLVIVLRSTGASHCCTKKVVAALRISMPAVAGRSDGTGDLVADRTGA
jgi:hypothetical protein